MLLHDLNRGVQIQKELETLRSWRKTVENAQAFALGCGSERHETVQHSSHAASNLMGAVSLAFNFNKAPEMPDADRLILTVLSTTKTLLIAEIDDQIFAREREFEHLGHPIAAEKNTYSTGVENIPQ